jgi:hypothetical protein
MAKKTSRSKPKKKDHSLKITFIILGTFLFLIIGGAFLQYKAQAAACPNSISCTKDLSGKKNTTNEGVFMGQRVVAPNSPDKASYALKDLGNVLGDSTATNKHIYVDLTNQRLSAFEGSTKVYDFPVSTGKWGATPTGEFHIWVWLRYTRMAGGSKALGTYYDLPNVPYTMYFYQGYGLHGAYWHNNFGHPMSHGCVNMRIEDAGKIFYWSNPSAGNVTYPTASNPGTSVTIYGTAPRS